MTIAEQAEAQKALATLSAEHRDALWRWAEVAKEHAALLAFLTWFRVETAEGGLVPHDRELISLYLEIDEDLVDAARQALLGVDEELAAGARRAWAILGGEPP